MFMASGVQGGTTCGATDELGYSDANNIVYVHELRATMLHLLGIDHGKWTFQNCGRDLRLTDVEGRAVEEIRA